MDVHSYLRRINIKETPTTPDFEFLALLHKQHMLSIPFENLDIMSGREIILDIEAFYNKIINNRRGGFCYELNGLLHWLLCHLGYKTSMISAQVLRSDGNYGPDFGHMALLVHLEHDYVVDVGFGDSVRSPLSILGEEVTDVSGRYRIRPNPAIENGYFFQKEREERWVSEYKFTTNPRRLSDYTAMCRFHQTSLKSHFTQNAMISLAKEKGRITLSGNRFIETVKQEKSIKTLSSSERGKLLEETFHISGM